MEGFCSPGPGCPTSAPTKRVKSVQSSKGGRYLTHNHEWLLFELVHDRRVRDRVAASETSIQPQERRKMSEIYVLNESDRCSLDRDVVPILVIGLLNLFQAQAIRSNT
jgi:hypothetical protein